MLAGVGQKLANNGRCQPKCGANSGHIWQELEPKLGSRNNVRATSGNFGAASEHAGFTRVAFRDASRAPVGQLSDDLSLILTVSPGPPTSQPAERRPPNAPEALPMDSVRALLGRCRDHVRRQLVVLLELLDLGCVWMGSTSRDP